jgi:hypothetical protein
MFTATSVRGTGRCGMTSAAVHLREITDDDRDAVCALRVRRRQ